VFVDEVESKSSELCDEGKLFVLSRFFISHVEIKTYIACVYFYFYLNTF